MGKRVMKTILAMSMILCLAVGNMTVAQAAGSKKTVKATSVVLNKSVYTLKKGGTVKLKATIAPKKATTRTLLWSSSNKKVATVDKAGKVKAKKNGKATITVKVKSTSKKASCKIIVGTPVTKVSVAKSSVTLIAGQTSAIKASVAPKTATTKSVAYASSNKRVATVSSGGVIRAVAAGTAKITVTAKDGTGKKATVNVTVKPRISTITLSAAKNVIEIGDSLQINANIAPSNAGNKTLTWTSSNAKVAAVDAKGKVVGKAEGTAVIKAAAQDGSNKAGTFTVTVKSKNRPVTKITLSASENELWTGDDPLVLQASVEPADSTNKKLVYESSNPDVAAVSENGEVTAVSAGTATITAKATDGSNVVSNGVEITVKVPLRNLAWNEASENLAVIDVNAQEETIGVVPIPSTAVITEITYESKNPDIVTVSDEGVLKGKKNGKTDIIVKASDERGNTVKIEKEVTVGTSVTGLTLSPESCELLVGGTRALTATVQPGTANVQTVTYSSTDESIASVDKNGLIHANAPGEASIIAKTTDGGFEKTCQVTVKAVETEKSVSSQSELDSALQDANLQVLKIAEKATDLSIGEGSYPNVSLIVNAPQGHIENRAVFRDITIQAISNTTFVEHATGNTIQYEATSGTVQIAEGASATVVVSGTENQQLSLVNDGTVSGLQISNASDVAISGASDQMIEVRASEDAENSTISTSKALNINSEAKLSLTLQSGAENTIATVTDETKIPEVQGLGSVPVTVLDSGNLETVVGENDGTEQSKKVKVSGDVRIGTEAAPGADVYIIPYSASITAENINDYLTSALHVQTDEFGKYQTEDISIGNYYMFVRFEGYMDVLETLVLTSAKDEIYYAEAITLIKESTETTGSLRGTLYDAQTGQRVQSGITLKIRSGKNNLSGDALAETVTLADGSYQFAELPAGQYTIQVLDNRNDPDGSYVTASFHAVVEAGKDNTANSTITYILASDQVRFVLTWGDEESGAPSDLDSHLIGPKAEESGQFHTWYGDRNYYDVIEDIQIQYADLDVDDTSWEGPETTTIYKKSEGMYHFYIHDFTNRYSESSTALAGSGAVVKVFVGSRLMETYNVPNAEGTLWYVCDYDAVNNKLIPKNKMSYWTEDPEEIGIDLFARYKEQLKSYIEKLTAIKEKITDTETANELAGMIAAAQTVYDTAEEQQELMDQVRILKTWISEYTEGARITDISGEKISRYRVDEIDIESEYINLYISGYSDVLPEFTVSVPEGSSYEVQTEENGDKVIVVTASNGYACKYRIVYALDESVFEVQSLSGTEMNPDEWRINVEYDENGDPVYVLGVTGFAEGLPDDFNITPLYSDTEVEIKASDKAGYEKMAVLSLGTASRTYYISYGISDVIPVKTVTGTDVEYWDSFLKYSEEDDTVWWELNCTGEGEALPEDLAITASVEGADVAFRSSDREGYDRMAVLSYKNVSTTYYLSYSTSTSTCYISDVTFTGMSTWDAGWVWDENDNEYNVLNLEGCEETLPSDLVITAYKKDATVEEKDSDRSGYEKMIVIRYGTASKTYYVSYKAVTPPIEKVEGTDISSWYVSRNNNLRELVVYGYCETLPGDLTVTCEKEEATAEVTDSDRTDYEKMVVVTYGNLTETYYIQFYTSSSSCRISEVEFTEQSNWYTDWEEDENGNGYDILVLEGYADTLPNDLKITPVKEEAQVTEEESDREGYVKKYIISYGTARETYYVSYKVVTPPIDTVEGSNIVNWYISHNELMELVVYGSCETLPENLSVLVNKEGASTEVKESDRDDYEKMVVVSYKNRTTNYYIKFYTDQSTCTISEVKFTDMNDWSREWNDELQCEVLNLKGYRDTLPNDLKITPVKEEAQVTEEESDKEGYEKKYVIRYGTASKTYYISYETVIPPITNVTGADINEWYINYSDDVRELIIYGEGEMLPDDLNISCSKGNAAVVIDASDKDGYEKMVTVTCHGLSEVYYLRYNTQEYTCEISTVTCSDLYNWRIAAEYDEESEETYDILNVQGYAETLPNDLVITPHTEKATVKRIASDRPDYEEMVVISYGTASKTYYISYEMVVCQES